jgi:hypothetical protein
MLSGVYHSLHVNDQHKFKSMPGVWYVVEWRWADRNADEQQDKE